MFAPSHVVAAAWEGALRVDAEPANKALKVDGSVEFGVAWGPGDNPLEVYRRLEGLVHGGLAGGTLLVTYDTGASGYVPFVHWSHALGEGVMEVGDVRVGGAPVRYGRPAPDIRGLRYSGDWSGIGARVVTGRVREWPGEKHAKWDGAARILILDDPGIVPGSVRVSVDGLPLAAGLDYVVDETAGTVHFIIPPAEEASVDVYYAFRPTGIGQVTDAGFEVQAGPGRFYASTSRGALPDNPNEPFSDFLFGWLVDRDGTSIGAEVSESNADFSVDSGGPEQAAWFLIRHAAGPMIMEASSERVGAGYPRAFLHDDQKTNSLVHRVSMRSQPTGSVEWSFLEIRRDDNLSGAGLVGDQSHTWERAVRFHPLRGRLWVGAQIKGSQRVGGFAWLPEISRRAEERLEVGIGERSGAEALAWELFAARGSVEESADPLLDRAYGRNGGWVELRGQADRVSLEWDVTDLTSPTGAQDREGEAAFAWRRTWPGLLRTSVSGEAAVDGDAPQRSLALELTAPLLGGALTHGVRRSDPATGSFEDLSRFLSLSIRPRPGLTLAGRISERLAPSGRTVGLSLTTTHRFHSGIDSPVLRVGFNRFDRDGFGGGFTMHASFEGARWSLEGNRRMHAARVEEEFANLKVNYEVSPGVEAEAQATAAGVGRRVSFGVRFRY